MTMETVDLGDWVLLPDDTAGQIWAFGHRHTSSRAVVWVADGERYLLAEVTDLRPAGTSWLKALGVAKAEPQTEGQLTLEDTT